MSSRWTSQNSCKTEQTHAAAAGKACTVADGSTQSVKQQVLMYLKSAVADVRLMPNTHCRRRRDETVEFRRVGGVNIIRN